MAIFSKNANRGALFGKQKLFKACCTPEVEECCYQSYTPKPGEGCNCNILFTQNVNGTITPVTINFLTLSQSADLPIEIGFYVENLDSCPIIISNIGAESTSPFFTFSFALNPFTLAANDNAFVFGLELSELAGPGSYTFDYYFDTDCGQSIRGTFEFLITS